jgi:hypothetical protein
MKSLVQVIKLVNEETGKNLQKAAYFSGILHCTRLSPSADIVYFTVNV